MSMRLPYLNSRLQGFGTTIFATMSNLAIETNSINLGQGFPDTDGPHEIAKAAIDAINQGHNQYPPGIGIADLRAGVALHQKLYYSIDLDPNDQVLITAGATEAIAATFLALCEVGDEVIVFDPSYDSYSATIAMAGARVVPVTLSGPNWSFNPEELRNAITAKTRAILINSPHNPTGKVFSREELSQIARVVIEHDIVAITDEVYEHIIFRGAHYPLSTFDGMAQRTLTISSGAKTFSFTGWKIGWITGPSELVGAVRTAKQFLTYVNGAPFQVAIAFALSKGRYFADMIAPQLAPSREILIDGLRDFGLDPIKSDGTYFVTTDISPKTDLNALDYCMELAHKAQVVAIPSSTFYARPSDGSKLLRWTFSKRPQIISEAMERLKVIK